MWAIVEKNDSSGFIRVEFVFGLFLRIETNIRCVLCVCLCVCLFCNHNEEKKMMTTTTTTNESIHPQETSETKRKKDRWGKKKISKNRNPNFGCVVSLSLSQSQITVLQVIHIQIKMTNEWKDAIWVTSEDDDNMYSVWRVCAVCVCLCVYVTRLFAYHFLWRLMVVNLTFVAAAVAIPRYPHAFG